MKKLLPFLLGIATIGWVSLGTLWYQQRFCAPPKSVTAAVVAVAVGNKSVEEGQMLLCFPQGVSQPILTAENVETLKQTANFLSKNGDKSLIINGLQGQNEFKNHPSVSVSNLALERAEVVKTSLVNLGAPTVSMTAKGQTLPNLAIDNGHVYEAVKFELVENPQGRFQALNLWYREKGFQFAENKELADYFTALWHFLEKNQTAKISVSAYQSNTEGGYFAVQRLQFLKRYLKGHDFNLKQFEFINRSHLKPINSDNTTNNNIVKNQRVEIRIQIV